MDFRQLEAFSRVVETGSFSRAAEALGVSQPTVSSHVTALERELGLTLIARTTREAGPTEAGRLLSQYAGQMLSLRRQADEALRRFATDLSGTVVIAASTIPGRYFLPRLLSAFQKQHSDVKFDLRITDSAGAVRQVTEREAELGFCGTLPGGKYVAREFANDQLVLVAPNLPKYRVWREEGVSLRRAAREPFVIREEGSGTRRETELFLRAMGVDPASVNIAAQAASNEEVERLVEEGTGVAILSKSAAEEREKLLTLELPGIRIRRKLYLLRRKNSVLSPSAQVFYSFAEGFYLPGPELTP
ncbi:selenium metabolism-associated LysR family transcriptional regulator [Oscillibacter sp.]|uniref:selenium metabolism-associated LysR family transcriptional regulator n=1 Tax=Oscillibacter sp. TaxID=1945593 RepID=UPI00289682A3|nr:selenium metabolism-associated LysR family transcriptional regulator [Oscillibacter sp.]